MDTKTDTRICPECGTVFSPSSPAQKYCSSECKHRHNYRKRYQKLLKERLEALSSERRICKQCGKSYTPTRRDQRYCSEECFRLAAENGLAHPRHTPKQPKKQYVRQCPQCGTYFIAHQSNQKYCCFACKRYHERHAEPEHPEDEALTDAPVLRTFRCKNCGKWISVTRETDKREVFCSRKCEKNFYKRRPSERAAWDMKKARHARIVREAMKGGESHG